MKALGYCEVEDAPVVLERLESMYEESRCCDYCDLEITGMHNASAIYINRTASWKLVHKMPCAVDATIAENRILAGLDEGEAA